MNENLNKLEFAIIQEVLKYNIGNKDLIKILHHIVYIKIRNRDFTGVGFFINFKYDKNIKIDKNINLSLSSEKNIKFKGFDDYFSFELDITKGKFNYLEIITYSNGWNGKYNSFIIE